MNYYNCETLLEQQQEIEKLKEQNAALAATVEALRDALQCLFNDIGGGKKFCEHDFNCVCAGDKARATLATTPQQHLAEIRAQAVGIKDEISEQISDDLEQRLSNYDVYDVSQQRLAESLAEAGRDGVLYMHHKLACEYAGYGTQSDAAEAEKIANQYADSILQGKKI